MNENIYEYIYLYFLKDEDALKSLISIYRPITTYLIRRKGIAQQTGDVLIHDYYTLADELMNECINRCQVDKYNHFSAFYKQALINKIIDFNRVFRNHQIEYHYPTFHLDMYVSEEICQYAYEVLPDRSINIHQQTLDKIEWEQTFIKMKEVFSTNDIKIFKYRLMGYRTSEIASMMNLSIRKVRYNLNKMRKWLMSH